MAVSVTTHIPNLPTDAYDSLAAQQTEPLLAAPGFISHTAAVSPAGITVVETWTAREHWQRFFDERIKPHLPPDLPAPTVAHIHNTIVQSAQI